MSERKKLNLYKYKAMYDNNYSHQIGEDMFDALRKAQEKERNIYPDSVIVEIKLVEEDVA
ncbi:MAG: hypothetical protein ACOC22_02995 [bacterium]